MVHELQYSKNVKCSQKKPPTPSINTPSPRSPRVLKVADWDDHLLSTTAVHVDENRRREDVRIGNEEFRVSDPRPWSTVDSRCVRVSGGPIPVQVVHISLLRRNTGGGAEGRVEKRTSARVFYVFVRVKRDLRLRRLYTLPLWQVVSLLLRLSS